MQRHYKRSMQNFERLSESDGKRGVGERDGERDSSFQTRMLLGDSITQSDIAMAAL